MQSFDQLDLTACASSEMVFRNLVRLQTAVRRNARNPDFTGLDIMLAASTNEAGGAVTRVFKEWVAEQQKK